MNDLNTLFSFLAAVGAFAAVGVAIVVAVVSLKKQTRLSLMLIRIEILADMSRFVNDILPLWNWNGDVFLDRKYSERQIEVLFDKKLADCYAKILKSAETCYQLRGDEDYARNHGTYHDKDENQIEEERMEIQKSLSKEFAAQNDRAYCKWIKV